MCGIIGIFDRENSSSLVINGLKLMSYRGLDNSGFIDNKSWSIGHCLHSVVGNVKQPLGNKNFLITNCEIYNWKELNEKFNFNTKNDSETLYLLLEKFGVEKTLGLLDGDYSCAYISKDKLYLFRDLVGVKPLWYSIDNFAFASEKKVLEKLSYKNLDDLNPRKILVYNLKTKKIKFIEREFYNIVPETNDSYEIIKRKTQGLLINSIAKRIPDCKFGLLFSGGVDSAFIALILKQLGVDFTCYIAVLNSDRFSQPKDLKFALDVAKRFDLNLKIIKVALEDVEKEISNVVSLIESSNITKVGVALPFYFASKQAREDGCKVILSGLGSEEIFAGYERHKQSGNINRECYSGLLWLYERDLYRDDVITMFNNLELRVPFLDKDLIEYALKIPAKYKINDFDKFVLRDIAYNMGLDKEFAFRKKVAAQYGSNFDKAIEKLMRKNNFTNKSEYINSLYNKSNVRLGVLFSGGKDSCYAMHVMHKQNYGIECLISIKSENKDSFMFHTPNIDLVKYQSKALEIPLVMVKTKGIEDDELKDLKLALKTAKNKYKIQGIVTGALFSIYQRDRIEKICDSLGLKVFSPLWHKSQLQELKEIVKEDFEVIIISIAADGFDKSWLGRKIDNQTINELEKLNKKFGINVAFEGGEAETFVLNAPMFKRRLEIKDAQTIMHDKYSGIYLIKKIKLTKN